ncbi:hypothetical protein ACWKSP_22405 [Micromonosporaceae bacterium Da 78-11]
MPAWPDKWDGLDTFTDALRRWDVTLPAEVRADVEQWISSRQDNPRDADPLPEEGLFDDLFTMRSRLVDIYRRPILLGNDQVVCFYELHDSAHRLSCLYFDTRPLFG